MPELQLVLVDEAAFDDIPEPVRPGARCRTCDYWERLDGTRDAPPANASDAGSRANLKRGRLLAAASVAGSYGMLGYRPSPEGGRTPIAYAQFGPLSAYPRALSIRERYRELPESPAPWVVTCLQVVAGSDAERESWAGQLLAGVCDELDRRGIIAVEAYPEVGTETWMPSTGPVEVYERGGFARVAGDDRYPVVRRELSGETDADAWSDLLRATRPADDDEDGWPLPLPTTPDPDDFFRLPPDRPKRPNPFGDD
jgi:hypothetical protein